MKTVIIVTVLIAAALAQNVDWAKQTADSIKTLPDSDFTTIKPEELAVIPVDAIPGLKVSQFSSIPAASFSGLQDGQFEKFTDLICAAFSPSFISNANSTSFSKFVPACIGVAPAESFSGFDAQRLSNVTAASFAQFSAAQLFNIPKEAAKGVTPAQISQMGTVTLKQTCLGLTSDFFNEISGESLLFLQSSCLSEVNSTVIAKFSAEKMAALPGKLGEALNPAQVQALNEGCAGLVPDFLAHIHVLQFQNLTKECVEKLQDAAFSLVLAQQVSNLQMPAVSALKYGQFVHFNVSAVQGFSGPQIGSFNKDSCGGISALFVSNINESAIPNLTKECVQSSNDTFFAFFTKAQAQNLQVEILKVLREGQVSQFKVDAVSGLSFDQIAALGYTTGCKGLNTGFVSNLALNSTAALTKECIASATDFAFAAVSADQIRKFTEISFQGFRKEHLEHFSLEAAAAVSPQQASQWGNETACSGLGALVASKLAVPVFSVFTKDCIAHTNDSFFAMLSAEDVQVLSNETFAGVRSGHFLQMSSVVAETLSQYQTSQFTAEACGGVTATVLGALKTATGLRGLSQACLSAIPGYSFVNFTSAQLNSLNCSVFNAQQVAHLSLTTFSEISILCIEQLTPDSFNGITPEQLVKLPSPTISLLTASQLSRFLPQTIRNMTLEQIDAISSNATFGFTADQLGNLTQQYESKFTDRMSVSKWNPNPESAQGFVQKVGVEVMELFEFVNFSNDTTWIQLAVLKTGNFTMDSNFVSRLQPMTTLGLRPQFVPQLKEEAVKDFTPAQTAYLLPSVVAKFSAGQVKGFTPAAFGNLYPQSFYSLSSDALKALSNEQVAAIPASVLKNCDFALALQNAGRTDFTGDAKVNYDACISTRTHRNGLTSGQIAGIVIGSIAGVALVGGIIFYVVRRRRAEYQAI